MDAAPGLPRPSRRRVLRGAGAAAGMLAAGGWLAADAAVAGASTVSVREHVARPLPFDAGKLRGLSRRLVESHWSNNYGGSVRALNDIRRRLQAAMSDATLPAYVFNDLKREHLIRSGSVVLHEAYFDGLGGNGRPPADLRRRIGRDFAGFDGWESEFRRVAAGLGGGSGWVMLGYNRTFAMLENYWMADHMHAPVATEPLLVLDMYEHAYHLDYGAAAARYIDAFFANLDWERIARRFDALG